MYADVKTSLFADALSTDPYAKWSTHLPGEAITRPTSVFVPGDSSRHSTPVADPVGRGKFWARVPRCPRPQLVQHMSCGIPGRRDTCCLDPTKNVAFYPLFP